MILFLLVGTLPAWGYYSSTWGYGPTGALALVLAIVLVLMVVGYLVARFVSVVFDLRLGHLDLNFTAQDAGSRFL